MLQEVLNLLLLVPHHTALLRSNLATQFLGHRRQRRPSPSLSAQKVSQAPMQLHGMAM